MALQLKPFDAARYLSTEEDHADLLADAFATGDQTYIANALGVVARATGMSQVARDAGVTREALYKALSPTGDPKLSTLLGVMKALGVSLTATPSHPAERT
ncbi:addiction module antidote protein [Paracoccus yeei]|uniref:addiction module antidote protein n=1 Tax=Paracoccus yeei TaxID=147645 RepID=UPI003BF81089